MSYKDIYNVVSVVPTLEPAVYDTNATVNGDEADRQFSESLLAVINAGAWTDGTHTITLEHSDDNVSYAAVPSGQYQGTNPVIIDDGDSDEQVYKIGYLGTKRYVRLSAVTNTATDGAVFGAVILKSHLRFAGSHQLTPSGQ